MSKRGSQLKLQIWIAAICLLVPSLTLIPLGGLWLFQNGWVIPWAAGAFAFAGLAFLIQLLLFRRVTKTPAKPAPALDAPDEEAHSWTPREQAAWNEVSAIAEKVETSHLQSREAFYNLGLRTVEAVAKAMHPERDDPLWQFTVPEALTLIERISQQLRPVIADSVPLGDQLTVGQVLRIYGWRGGIDVFYRGYDIWRIVRLLNPVSAVTQELRERLNRQLYEWGRDEIARRLARAYVREVGRAAIDLYSGRLRVTAKALAEHVSEASLRDRERASRPAEPLRLLVAGQLKAGKSSLINALLGEVRTASDVLPATGEFIPFEIRREGVPEALILDSPGLTSAEQPVDRLIQEIAGADLIIWVASAVRPDREIDRAVLAKVRRYFADRPNRRRPPMLLVLSHIDRLRPFQEWQPPYDLASREQPKVASILAAIEAAGADLAMPPDAIVPACLDPERGLYNIDAVWAKVIDSIPDAQRAQLVRCLGDIERNWDWRKIRTQAVNAGRVLTRAFWSADGKDEKTGGASARPGD
jgi:predicted GTPase